MMQAKNAGFDGGWGDESPPFVSPPDDGARTDGLSSGPERGRASAKPNRAMTARFTRPRPRGE
eukprot:645094-Alexandrium_andersonii.AAC.1